MSEDDELVRRQVEAANRLTRRTVSDVFVAEQVLLLRAQFSAVLDLLVTKGVCTSAEYAEALIRNLNLLREELDERRSV